MPIDEQVRNRLVPAAVLGVCLMLGLILGGWLLGSQIKATRLADRYVAVKGLVERTVKSDAAIWPVTFKEAGNDLPSVFAKSEADKNAVLKFFAEQGIASNEITIGQIQVTDKQANEFGGSSNAGPRYIVQQTVTVSSKDVDKIARAGQKTAELVQAGIVVGGGYGQGIRYVFNGLNALKPDMITEATRNARAAADRFAADSGSQVGEIRSANQGVFSISSADAGSATGGDGGDTSNISPDSSIMKKVRVVSTVDYYLVR
ncbi:SIMPL domain-containing protein [Edaphobacter acidisoli]|uniref:SIMPL domain-containing protein n=1 Tax=Edaphobacter acidisoli TaxID=2040573 RepID=UPI001E3B29F2|nr:SIMPL domain-containing protein [Edaphobacter acidisoli]